MALWLANYVGGATSIITWGLGTVLGGARTNPTPMRTRAAALILRVRKQEMKKWITKHYSVFTSVKPIPYALLIICLLLTCVIIRRVHQLSWYHRYALDDSKQSSTWHEDPEGEDHWMWTKLIMTSLIYCSLPLPNLVHVSLFWHQFTWLLIFSCVWLAFWLISLIVHSFIVPLIPLVSLFWHQFTNLIIDLSYLWLFTKDKKR